MHVAINETGGHEFEREQKGVWEGLEGKKTEKKNVVFIL